jgi:hypothetical protein
VPSGSGFRALRDYRTVSCASIYIDRANHRERCGLGHDLACLTKADCNTASFRLLRSPPLLGLDGRVLATENEGIHRAHSGKPAFRRPSINSLAPRGYCKGGIGLKDASRRLARLDVTSEMGESGRETAVSRRIEGLHRRKLFHPRDISGTIKLHRSASP